MGQSAIPKGYQAAVTRTFDMVSIRTTGEILFLVLPNVRHNFEKLLEPYGCTKHDTDAAVQYQQHHVLCVTPALINVVTQLINYTEMEDMDILFSSQDLILVRLQADESLLLMGHVSHACTLCITAGPKLSCPDHTGYWAADTVQLGYLSCGQTVMRRNMYVIHMAHQQHTDLTVCICATSLAGKQYMCEPLSPQLT